MLTALSRALADKRSAGQRLTDTDLAAATGMSKNTIGRRLSGDGNLSPDEFEALAEAIGLDVDDLWRRARAIQDEPADTLSEHITRQLSPEAQEAVRIQKARLAEGGTEAQPNG